MRKYGKDDHESVCRLFYTTVMESWLPSYRRVVTFKAPIATIVQVVYLKMNHHYCNSHQLINITIRALPWPCYITSPRPSSGSCWPSSSSRCSSWSPSSTSTGATAGKDAKLDKKILDDLHCQRPGSNSTQTWLIRSCLTGLAGCCQTIDDEMLKTIRTD